MLMKPGNSLGNVHLGYLPGKPLMTVLTINEIHKNNKN